jgi:hypothetical protein
MKLMIFEKKFKQTKFIFITKKLLNFLKKLILLNIKI